MAIAAPHADAEDELIKPKSNFREPRGFSSEDSGLNQEGHRDLFCASVSTLDGMVVLRSLMRGVFLEQADATLG